MCIMKITNKDCKNKCEMNTENYLMRKKIYKESMEDIEISLNRTEKESENSQKTITKQKNVTSKYFILCV